VAGRDRGFGARKRRQVSVVVIQSYRQSMRRLASMRTMDLWYSGIDVDQITAVVKQQESARRTKRYEKDVAKARSKDSLRAFDKLTHVVDGEPRIVSDPPLIVPIEELAGEVDVQALDEFVRGALRSYRRSLPGDRRHLLDRFRYVHAARKVVGVGSVGTRAWIALFVGRDDSDPLFLQLKEADASVLESFLNRSEYTSHGRRVVEGQRLMQTASDIMLGWNRVTGVDGVERDFYMRQLWDQKGSADIETMNRKALTLYAKLCGQALARAHARSGDAAAIAAYMGSGDALDLALAEFAEIYADQNQRDYDSLKQAAESGRITATPGL
jgi:hypothetical protein